MSLHFYYGQKLFIKIFFLYFMVKYSIELH